MSDSEKNEQTSQDENFEQLFEQSQLKNDDFAIGDEVTGKIVFITRDTIFVDISGKSEAIIDKMEFTDNDGNCSAKTGDTIKAYIVAMRGGEITMTTKIGNGPVSAELLENARKFAIPVEGTVITLTNGGYRVSISGIECFCPFSQFDIKPVPQPETVVGNSFSFKVIQITERGRNIVLSRRALLEEQQQQRENELRSVLKEGDILSGTVVSIQKFGVFVDIGGIEMLVPRTELSWSRSVDPSQFATGQKLQAKVLSIDWDSKRIVASVKQNGPEPWDGIAKYTEGQEVNGTIVNIIKNGAFVEIEPGIDGFLPVSRMSYTKRINRPEDAVSLGSTVTVKLIDIDAGSRKISLELVTGEPDPWQTPLDSIREASHSGIVESSRPNGITLRLSNGMVGFMPREESAMARGGDLQSAYPAGKEIKVAVRTIDKNGKKLILSELEALRREERQDYEKFMNQQPAEGTGSAFGRLFKQKFDDMQKKEGK